jgi:hypothetical protein
MMEVEVVLDAGATIGESPTWATAEGALYWIDVKKPALCRYDPATGDQGSWPMPSDIGAFALAPDPHGAVVALRDGIFHLDLASGALTCLAPPPFDPGLFRFNEGAVDVTGRFWVDVMFDPLDGTPPPQKSSLHSFTLAGGLRAEPGDRDVALPVSQPTMCAFAGEASGHERLRRRPVPVVSITPFVDTSHSLALPKTTADSAKWRSRGRRPRRTDIRTSPFDPRSDLRLVGQSPRCAKVGLLIALGRGSRTSKPCALRK